ncbi:aminotransferase class I/II-fold pyridoxal phosphate-dependent enzyme [candidate division KSB1 bacterium]|nr:aminotransferase class I/II-fold pyridoxal phosphate-dependent enzyme [candidate division KSB1 bacterium]
MFPEQNQIIDQISESVIREMTRLAEKHQAINLAQGLPDYPCPSLLKAHAQDAIGADENQYSFTYGLKALRDAIAAKLLKRNQLQFEAETEITVTCGVSEGLMATVLALGEPGAEFILLEPCYENYLPAVLLSGATPVPFTLNAPDWHIDFDELAKHFSHRTRAIILNNPMNPTGKVFSTEELREIAMLCQKWDTVALCDEIYEEMVYNEQRHISMASLPGMRSRTVTIMGFSKTYSVTGWRVGYVAAYEALSARIRKVHDYLTVCAPTPLQHACIAALSLPEQYYDDLKRFYYKKCRLFCLGLEYLGFRFAYPEAAYYVMADFRDIFNGNDLKFSDWLLIDKGVAVVPGSSFYFSKKKYSRMVRFCFAKKEETLVAALRRMGRKIFRDHYRHVNKNGLLV